MDGGVAIDGAYFTRRAILLAIHDMKDNLKAPIALQETALAELLSLKVRPTPELKLYRDIATALLRMEVVLRSTAMQAVENGETSISDECLVHDRARKARVFTQNIVGGFDGSAAFCWPRCDPAVCSHS